MSRHSFSLLLFVSFLGAITALSLVPINCKELFRDCNGKAVCGIRTCTVVERCCTTGWGYRCHLNKRKERECGPFQCENGGTRIPTKGKRDISDAGCEIPRPRCACPRGFGGRCCEELIDPCTYTKCGAGQICKPVKVECVKAPCPLQGICVPDAGICPLFPNTITTCEVKPFACTNNSHCLDGQLCCDKGCSRQCMKSLPTGTTGCARVVCRPGTVCREDGVLCLHDKPCEMQVRCVPEVVKPIEKPGRCPRYTEIAKLPCEKRCSDDSDCKGKQKCCEKHCSRVCVGPDLIEENPCATVDCRPGKVCVPGPFPCLIPPCDNFRCVPEKLDPPAPCPLVLCPKGQICKEVPIACLIPPCPRNFQCVDRDLDPCVNIKIKCPGGTSCAVRNGRPECVRPGTCPKFPGLITTCEIRPGHCLSDIECQDGEKCCSKGCGRECVPIFKVKSVSLDSES